MVESTDIMRGGSMILLRLVKANSYTLGILMTDGGVYYTLEPPWRDNRRNESCIPPGEYEYVYMPVSASGKYRDVLHIRNVPGRSGILMHSGNVPGQTKGCILPGKKVGYSGGSRAVWNSKLALNEITRENKRGKLRVV